jgi:DNA-binding response OmpR family regulator
VRHKILVVDDELDICRILQVFLTKKGFIVLTAGSGEVALEIINKEKLDLLLLDVNMPGIGSKGVLIELEKKNLDIPVIIITGAFTDLGFQKDFRMIKEVALKPIDLNALLEKVKETLSE